MQVLVFRLIFLSVIRFLLALVLSVVLGAVVVVYCGLLKNPDGEVYYGEGENANTQADNGVKDGFLGFFDFGGFARRGHIIDTTYNNEDDGDYAKYADYCVNNIDSYVWESIFCAATAVGFSD